MARPKPFTQSDIEKRASWPEIQAALDGPKGYEACGILDPTQRHELVRLARVAPEQERSFIDAVTCLIIGYRLNKRSVAQESPAAVAKSMRLVIDMVHTYAHDVSNMPQSVISELVACVN